jgi:hypothetical protein
MLKRLIFFIKETKERIQRGRRKELVNGSAGLQVDSDVGAHAEADADVLE